MPLPEWPAALETSGALKRGLPKEIAEEKKSEKIREVHERCPELGRLCDLAQQRPSPRERALCLRPIEPGLESRGEFVLDLNEPAADREPRGEAVASAAE